MQKLILKAATPMLLLKLVKKDHYFENHEGGGGAVYRVVKSNIRGLIVGGYLQVDPIHKSINSLSSSLSSSSSSPLYEGNIHDVLVFAIEM